MKTYGFKHLPLAGLDYFIWLHTADPPSDADWSAGVAELREYLAKNNDDISRLRAVVLTDGGGPSTLQRKALNEVYQGRPVKVAVISNSTFVRAIGTAMSWFGVKIKVLAPRDIVAALAFVDLPADKAAPLWETLDQMQANLATVNVVGQARSAMPGRSRTSA